jgi:superfamily I DNA/RNA helicase
MGAIDFDEQIYGAVEALLLFPETRQAVQKRCAHVLLDELQDLTPAQLLMVRLLAAPGYDVYGVGDDDQVIYGYAGASPRFLVDYDHYFPGAASFLLEVNYRCPPAVVEGASQLLSYNHIRVRKEIRSAESGTAGLTIERLGDADMGARLVDVIDDLVSNDGVDPADIAVLARVNAGLLAPQVLLAEAGIAVEPAVDERMLDRTGTKAALSWLRLAAAAGANNLLDGSDLATVAKRPSRGLSPGLLKALGRGEWSMGRLDGFASGLDDARLRTRLTGLHDDLAKLGRLAKNGATTAELLMEVRDKVGLAQALDRLDDARSAPGGGHIDDLDALVLVARAHPEATDFEAWLRQRLRRPKSTSSGRSQQQPRRQAAPSIPSPEDDDGWLASLAASEPPDDGYSISGGPAAPPPKQVVANRSDDRDLSGTGDIDAAPGGRVTLSTVHRVKGLEWPHVIVWDASEGVMPHRLNEAGPDLEEERRVFHVAVTRARESAIVMSRATAPSVFLDELIGQAPHLPPPTVTSETGRRRRAAEAQAGGDGVKLNAAERLRERRAKREKSAEPAVDLDEAGTRRATALREWRLTRAKADGVPAYVVINDRHLTGIAARNPTSLDELAACDGIGPTKLDRYGDDILSVLERLDD